MTLLTDSAEKMDDFSKSLGSILYNFPLKPLDKATYTMKCVKMRKVHELLKSDEKIAEDLLSHDCSFGIRLASRDLL